MKKFAGKSPSILAMPNRNQGDMSGSLSDRYGLPSGDPWFPYPGNPLAGGIQPGNLNDGLIQITEMITLLASSYLKQLAKLLGLQKEDETRRGTRAFRSFWPSLRARTDATTPALLAPRPVVRIPVQKKLSDQGR